MGLAASISFTYIGSNSPAATLKLLHGVDHDTQEQDAQLSQRDRAAGCVRVFAKSRRLELGDNILRTV